MPNDPKDTRRDPTDPPASESGEASSEKRSGRVTFDSRGNSVWEWQLETGVYSRDVNTQKLKKLDLGDLSIAETAIQKGPLSLEDEPPSPGGGFNPYNRGVQPQREATNPYDNARALSKKLAPKADAPPEKPRSLDDLRKLSEQIKQQRKARRE